MCKIIMKVFVNATVRLMYACRLTYARKWSFLGLFLLVFLGSVGALSKFDFLPSLALAKVSNNLQNVANQSAAISLNALTPMLPELPTKIVIPTINLSATVANPEVTDASILDGDLLKGAVRYPTSARLNENGNVVLFGHSSYLPIVNNQAYKTFNGIQKLSIGDLISVYSSDAEYVYKVKSVDKKSADKASIPLLVSGKLLTLSTCDSFSSPNDRFVVVADFVESHPASL